MHRGLAVVAVLAALFSVLMDSGTAAAEETPSCTITVQPGESIQAAIDAAPEGALICLASGEWQENLTISKSLTIRSQGTLAPWISGQE